MEYRHDCLLPTTITKFEFHLAQKAFGYLRKIEIDHGAEENTNWHTCPFYKKILKSETTVSIYRFLF